MFKPGDKVTPSDQWSDKELSDAGLSRGAEYTVLDAWWERKHWFGAGITLVEVKLVEPEIGFKAKFWRKVQKRSTETGMAILRGIADGTRQPETEAA